MRRVRTQDLDHLVGGYVSEERYAVRWTVSRRRITFDLVRTSRRRPFQKRYPHGPAALRRYADFVRQGWSVGAYDGDELVGLAIVEPRRAEESVFVWELGVATSHQRQGIATRLLSKVVRRAQAGAFRAVVCETQTTNVPAIDFYRAAGFRPEGVNLSEYSNEDLRRGEVALFMKRRIPPARRARRGRRPRRPRTSK